MTTVALAATDVLLTGPGRKVPVPSWIRRFAPQTATAGEIRRLDRLPRLTVVEAAAPAAVLGRQGFLELLAARHESTPAPSKVVFVFEKPRGGVDADTLAELLGFFDRAADVEFAVGAHQAAFTMEEALAKIVAFLRREPPPPSDPLGEVRSVLAATADLRAESGRLSAARVAKAFDLPAAEIARLAGKSRQAVSKTDDAESLQAVLRPFERIARLRAALADADFRAWLHSGNDELGGRTPLQVIQGGGAEVVADLAADLLTGSPT